MDEATPGAPKQLLQVSSLGVFEHVRNGARRDITRDISFTVHRGETLGLVGESGSGKSLTAMSIIGLLPKQLDLTGSIILDGTEISHLAGSRFDQVRRSDVAVIFQEPMTALNPVYTIEELMLEAMRHLPFSKREQRVKTLELLEMVKLPDPQQRLKQYPHQLSGGQLQRVMIAIAISRRPKLLIADEPTTALDVTVQADILDLLSELQDEIGMGVLLISHDMGVIANSADRVTVMRNGSMIESGAVDDVFYRPQMQYTRDLLNAVPSLVLSDTSDAHEDATTPVTEVLSFKNLSVTFKGSGRKSAIRAVSDVNLNIYDNQVVGVVGESGSGKTTLGRVAAGLQVPTSGTAFVTGIDRNTTRSKDQSTLRRNVSMVFQDSASTLDPRQTIGNSVASPLRWNRQLSSRDRNRVVGDLLEMVGISRSWIDRRPHELSGGQKQRVSIARALSTKPKLLIADEPTSSLDVIVQDTVLELFKELQAALGFACFFISHDLAVVQDLADRVMVLRNGRLVEEGPSRQVIDNPQAKYTRELLAAAPIPDPELQHARRAERIRVLHNER